MMFIINFDYVTDEENVESPEKFNQILPAKVANRKCVYFVIWRLGATADMKSNHDSQHNVVVRILK